MSAQAVSFVVNGRTDEVGEATRARIEAAIASLGYRPQRRGKSLRLDREFLVALVIVDPSPDFLSDPFTTQIAAGLSHMLAERGYGLTLRGCTTPAQLAALTGGPMDADVVVLLASGPAKARAGTCRAIAATGVPVLVVQDRAPDDLADVAWARQDDAGGARQLRDLVLAGGASRLLFVRPVVDWPAMERREAGLAEGLPAGVTLQVQACEETDFDGCVQAVGAALDAGPRPDAILGGNDQIAIAALEALSARNLRVPDDVQVTGFNGFAFRRYARPLLSTVRSRAAELGRLVAEMVLDHIGTGCFSRREVELALEVDVGQSTRAGRP